MVEARTRPRAKEHTPKHILVVEDEEDIRNLLGVNLQGAHYSVDLVATDQEFHERFAQHRPDLVLLDHILPGSSQQGLDLLDDLTKSHGDIPVILVTGAARGTLDIPIIATQKGAYDFIRKPFDKNELLAKIKEALMPPLKLSQQIREFRESFQNITDDILVGESLAMQRVAIQIGKITVDGDDNVLIWGETGTGKNKVARIIHRHSIRHDYHFEVLDVTTIAMGIAESELYGIEKGVATGVFQSDSRIESADKGTLFVDEINKAPKDLQAKLLSIADHQPVPRAGGRKPRRYDIRLIAASSEDLEKKTERGEFLPELYSRLRGNVIYLPPLRERREDILPLAAYFLEEWRRVKKEGIEASQEAADKLNSYDYPYNARQLRNAIRNAATFAKKGIIKASDISFSHEEEQTPPLSLKKRSY